MNTDTYLAGLALHLETAGQGWSGVPTPPVPNDLPPAMPDTRPDTRPDTLPGQDLPPRPPREIDLPKPIDEPPIPVEDPAIDSPAPDHPGRPVEIPDPIGRPVMQMQPDRQRTIT